MALNRWLVPLIALVLSLVGVLYEGESDTAQGSPRDFSSVRSDPGSQFDLDPQDRDPFLHEREWERILNQREEQAKERLRKKIQAMGGGGKSGMPGRANAVAQETGRLGGIVITGRQRTAIIDDAPMSEGDTRASITVLKIEPRGVVLRRQGRTHRVVLPPFPETSLLAQKRWAAAAR